MIYDSKEEALIENPGALSAAEIVEVLKDRHGYILHATNAGQDAAHLKAKFVEHYPLNQQSKPSKLYLATSVESIIDSLITKAKRRESFGQSVK